MKKLLPYLVVALIATALGAALAWNIKDKKEAEPEVVYDTIIKHVVDSVPFSLLDTAKVVITPVKLTVPAGEIKTTLLVDSVEVKTNKYEGIERLDNGTIFWTAYADKLYGTEFVLSTKQETITKTKTIYKTKSRLYAGLQTNFDIVNSVPSSASLGLMYNVKQKFAVSLSVTGDFSGLLPPEKTTTLGVGVWIGL